MSAADSIFDPRTQLGRDLAAVDWAASPLGPVETWPPSLRNVVRLQLASRFAMWMAWGPELTFLCNDTYRRSTLGAKYPWALGRPAREVWSEIWPDIGPRIASVMSTGESTWDESLMLFLERSGYPEETYHTFSYSPLTDDAGEIAGMLCVVTEETARVIGERRMATVRELGTALAAASTVEEVNAAAGRQLTLDGRSVPFAIGYLFDEQGSAHLAWTAGVPENHEMAPKTIALDDPAAAWPAAAVLHGGTLSVGELAERWEHVPSGYWDEPPERALVLPLAQPGRAAPLGFLVAGLNRYRPLDRDARSFLELLAGQVSAALGRAQAFEEERRRAEDLAELDRAKTTFFTNVSHELRTPLTLLLGPAGDALVDADSPLPPEQRRRVEVIQRNGERLLKLVNTLLDFSRLESGRMAPRFEPLDLAAYTSELAGMFESAMLRAGLRFSVECVPLRERPFVDREMWAKVVLNLLSNALKATFEGSVSLRLDEHDGAVELSVQDTGVGIPHAEQSRLFERFHRVVGARLRSHEGSGIGLALVAELAALHGGTVSVASEPHVGSRFTVRIPFGDAHLPAEQVQEVAEADVPSVATYGVGYLAEADRWLAGDDLGEDADPDGAHRPVVLVVDDNADMREYVGGLLRQRYAVRTAVDGAQALEMARERPPQLVLTDVMMPRLDGFGLLAELRADPNTMHIPVVMLSARSGDEAAVVGLEAGADDYLIKPFSARELQARVQANLELDRVRRVADELARNRMLLDQAEELAHLGSWELDGADGRITASPEFLRILGVSAEALQAGGIDRVFDVLRATDRARFQDGIRRALVGGEPLTIEIAVPSADGPDRLVRTHGVRQRTSEGRVVLRGSVQDVTDQRAAERALAASAAAREAATREHAIAEELQRSLLPSAIHSTDHLDVATYYVSGVEGTQAGGDWYDVVPLGDGRTALVVGDVMGRGVRAAAVMGQLRASVRAYARLDLTPDRLLGLLDATLRDTDDATIVTCVYAVHDPAAGTLTYGNAGHLPPMLTRADGRTTRLLEGDPPLGTGRYRGNVETVAWPPGARLTLYTDGLVEHRGSDIDTGIDTVERSLGDAGVPVEAVPNVLVDAVLSGEPDDDVAILVAETRAPTTTVLGLPLPLHPAGVAEVRRRVREAMAAAGVDEDAAADALLVASELATNVVRYGRAPARLSLRIMPGDVVIDVSDCDLRRPQASVLDPAAANGRGLHMVSSVAARWGVRPTGIGKSVWSVVHRAGGDRTAVSQGNRD
jgi:PAS domain S-box-containing protein